MELGYISGMKKHMHDHRHRNHTRLQPFTLLVIITIAIVAVAGFIQGKKHTRRGKIPILADLHLTCSAFKADGTMPEKYTYKGANMSPPLSISGTPEGTLSLALIAHDSDAPDGDFVHWTMWNINPNTTSIAENKVPTGALQGTNGFGDVGYSGPYPPAGSGTHRYHFDLYALRSILDVPAGAKRQELMKAIETHAIGRTQLVGTFSAD